MQKNMMNVSKKIEDAARNFRLQTVDYKPQRPIFFLLTGKKETAAAYAQYMEQYARNLLRKNMVFCLHEDTAMEMVEDFKTMQEISRSLADGICIIPVMIQDEDSKDHACVSKMETICDEIRSYLNNIIGFSTLWFSVVVLNRHSTAQQRSSFLEKASALRRRLESPFIILQDSDAQNQVMLPRVIAHTLLMSGIFLSTNDENSSIRSASGEEQAFSARAFTIRMPVYRELLDRVVNLLEYFLERPDEAYHEEHLKELGGSLSRMPRQLWWANTWKYLPTEGEKISIEPVRSFDFSTTNDETVKSEKIRLFGEKYYLSHMPVDDAFLRSNLDNFLANFKSCYCEKYGSYVQGLDAMFNPGCLDNFIQTYISPLDVRSASYGTPESQEDVLKTKIQQRNRELYQKLLKQDGAAGRIQANHQKAIDILTRYLELFKAEHNCWSQEELPPSGEYVWTEKERMDLMKCYLDMLYDSALKENSEKMLTFINTVFRIVQNKFQMNTADYLNRMKEEYAGLQNAEKTEFLHNCISPVQHLLCPSSVQTNSIRYVMLAPENQQEELGRALCPTGTTVRHVEKMNDRIELLEFCQPFHWKVVYEIKSAEPQGVLV